MNKTKEQISRMKRRIAIDVDIELRTQRLDAERTKIVVTASKGVFSAVHTVDRHVPHERIEDAVDTVDGAIATACDMLKEALGNTARDLGLEASRPARRRILDYVETDNKERAGWVEEVLRLYEKVHYGAKQDPFVLLSDFLCNFRHYADRKKLDWTGVTQRAADHYIAEKEEEKIVPTEEPKKGKKRHGNHTHRR